MKKFLISLALTAAAAVPVQASTVFSDNFDSNTLATNSVPAGWTVTAGTVDVIGAPAFFDLVPGNGRYIDLDGSTNDAGLLSMSFSSLAAGTYTLTFDLAGSHRGTAESVTVSFGGTSQLYALASNDGFTTFSLTAMPVAGNLTLSFQNAGGDNVGALLDNVKITAVPEPESGAMLLAGLAALGAVARRRRV